MTDPICQASLAPDDWLTPKIIGDTSRTAQYDEQSLKRIWHYLARFGNLDDP